MYELINLGAPASLPAEILSPIAGLYLAGHWTQPGSGVWTVVLSGINAARYALGGDKSAPMWPLNFQQRLNLSTSLPAGNALQR